MAKIDYKSKVNNHQQKLFLLQVNFKRQGENHFWVFVVLHSVDRLDQKFHLCFLLHVNVRKQKQFVVICCCTFCWQVASLISILQALYVKCNKLGVGTRILQVICPPLREKQRLFISIGASVVPTPLSSLIIRSCCLVCHIFAHLINPMINTINLLDTS